MYFSGLFMQPNEDANVYTTLEQTMSTNPNVYFQRSQVHPGMIYWWGDFEGSFKRRAGSSKKSMGQDGNRFISSMGQVDWFMLKYLKNQKQSLIKNRGHIQRASRALLFKNIWWDKSDGI
jgi:hypothetical protein